jgi:diguanylate cyclase
LGPASGPLAVILCDIDNFKGVNDTHGHAAGDAVLLRFSRLLQGVVREGLDSVVRYGGEEFRVILPGTGLDEALRLAEWLRSRFGAAPVNTGPGGTPVYATASFGVAAAAPGSSASLEALIDAADKLMYTAKRNGRDRVEALALPALPLAAAA